MYSKRSMSVLLGLLLGSLSSAHAQAGHQSSGEVAALRAEVQRLTIAILQDRAEMIEWRMQWTHAELQQIQEARQRIISDRQVLEKEIGELNQASSNGAGGEDEERKQDLTGVQVPALLASERAALAREATLLAAVAADRARLEAVHKDIERLRKRSQD